ncbi:uri1, prefoldin-like chaperone [Allomyces javanicus]|nr:uri1, prefoldin-like chaperone [Allomyces javanicus]
MDPAAHDRAIAHLAHLHADADRHVHQWTRLQTDYRDLHTTLSTLPDKVSHTVMVPFGPLAFMPGKLVHTNEITVMLGDNWFAERSARQAVGVVERRLKVVDGELQQAAKDRDALAAKLAVLTGAPLPGTSAGAGNTATPTADVTEDGLPIMEIRETEDEPEPQPAPASFVAPADVSANLDAMFQTMRDLELKVQSGAARSMSDEDARFLDEAFANVPDDDEDEDEVNAVEALPLDDGSEVLELDPDSDASAIVGLDPESDDADEDAEVPPLRSSLMPSSRRGSGADKRVQFASTDDEVAAATPAPLASAVTERPTPTTSSVFGHVMERHVLERAAPTVSSERDLDEYDSSDDMLTDAMHQRELVQAYHTTRRRLVKSMLRSRDDADFHGAQGRAMNFRTPLVDDGRDWREEVQVLPDDEARRVVPVVMERVAPVVKGRAVPVVRERAVPVVRERAQPVVVERVAPVVVERAPPAAARQQVEQAEPPRRVSKFRQQRMQRGG